MLTVEVGHLCAFRVPCGESSCKSDIAVREFRMLSLPILYQDEHLVAVNKPWGLLVHRTDLDRHETENAMHIVRDQLGQWVYPFHRLDKATSGVLLFALDQETARRMTQSFAGGKIAKTYLA